MGSIKVIFVVDANAKIGFGHLNRCHVLAQELQKEIHYEIFFSFADTDDQTKLEFGKKFRVIPREKLFSEFQENKKMLIIDSQEELYYQPQFQQEAIASGFKLVHFAVSDQFEYHSDALINPNIHALKLSFKVIKERAKVLLGPKFFIFRGEFRNVALTKENKEIPIKDVLISFGAADPNDFSADLASLLISIEARKSYKIITGPLYKGKIAELALPENVQHITSPGSMVDFMLNSNLAICSFGSTFWELASLKIPAFVVATSDREIYTYDLVKDDSIFEPLGNFRDPELSSRFKRTLMKIEDENAPLSLTSSEFKHLIDVNGVVRIVSHINQLFN